MTLLPVYSGTMNSSSDQLYGKCTEHLIKGTGISSPISYVGCDLPFSVCGFTLSVFEMTHLRTQIDNDALVYLYKTPPQLA